MTTLPQTVVTWQDGDVFRAAQLDGDAVQIRQTRSDLAAADGEYGNIVASIPLAEAIAIAKALLQSEAPVALDDDDDPAFDAWIERMAEMDEERRHAYFLTTGPDDLPY